MIFYGKLSLSYDHPSLLQVSVQTHRKGLTILFYSDSEKLAHPPFGQPRHPQFGRSAPNLRLVACTPPGSPKTHQRHGNKKQQVDSNLLKDILIIIVIIIISIIIIIIINAMETKGS